MAVIRRVRHGPEVRVAVKGTLGAADLRRLEHACSPALVSYPAPLELDLRRLTSIDPSAEALIAQLGRRGARILRTH